MLRINVVTLFPEVFEVPCHTSIMGRAAEQQLVSYRVVDLRGYTHDRHRTVDDSPFGGGAGMVLKPEPFYEALDDLAPVPPVVLLSARGEPFRHDMAVRYSVAEELTLLCGHYKDVDERVALRDGVEQVAFGDAVLSGGEFAALCVMDAVVRLLPGALGDHDSAAGDSFYDGLLSPPSYTRPREYRGHAVPEVLVSGDHAAIEAWRRQQALELTQKRRPDLWARHEAEHRSDGTER
ncbi:MAG: tRNA (guanosine(37)-N1)-methyltransferase TrmD [Gemmatimonadota bacterium]|nr:tRNA (guanosine(37)-N1)-methyltransferase TrmD [Gemmatimonadota bacterium]